MADGLDLDLFGGQVRLQVVFETDEAISYLEAISERAAHPEGFWEGVGDIMRQSFHENFAAGGRPSWSPLKPATVARKMGRGLPALTPSGNVPLRLVQRGQFGPANILIESGGLRDSWVQKGASGHVEEIEGDEFFIGSNHVITRQVSPEKPIDRPYLRGGKTPRGRRSRGGQQQVSLAVIHELGAPGAGIPARRTGLVQPEDLEAIQDFGGRWLLGEER